MSNTAESTCFPGQNDNLSSENFLLCNKNHIVYMCLYLCVCHCVCVGVYVLRVPSVFIKLHRYVPNLQMSYGTFRFRNDCYAIHIGCTAGLKCCNNN